MKKTDKTKVSIIIPVYNAEKYLSKCLDSIINQTLKDIEIICIDDGSTDSSLEILQNYAKKDKRFQVIHQKNSKQGAARNKGINIAKGKFIGFVDSDDWISPNFYENLYNTAKTYNADIAACNVLRIEEDGQKIYFIKYTNIQAEDRFTFKMDLLKSPQFNYVVNKIYSRKLLTSNNLYFKENVFFEDIWWTPQVILHAKKIVTLPSETYYYAWTQESTCTQTANDCKKLQDFKDGFCWMENFMAKYYAYTEYKKYKLFGFIPLLSIEEFKRKNYKKPCI